MECRGNQSFACNSAGNGYELDNCPVGCVDGPPPHCKYLQPLYLPDICDTPAQTPSIAFTNSGTFDPNVDTNCNGGVFNQPGAPSICIVRYGSITLPSTVVLTILGTKTALGRAIAFVADDTLEIDGTLDVGAHNGANGPGGGFNESGGHSTALGSGNTSTGGGGAGGATDGGAGGTGAANGGGDNGGSAATNPGLLSYFVGGASADRSNVADDQDSEVLGGGGGALTLVSCHGAVSISGTISAGGGGGVSAVPFLAPLPGFGGGAGGTVVVQGLSLEISGSVYANGGGGGGGITAAAPTMGSAGTDGLLSDAQAAPGGNTENGAGAGGFGGYVGNTPYFGSMPTAGSATAGGGGGSVGFLLTYTPSGVTPTVTPAHASPAFQPNGTVETR